MHTCPMSNTLKVTFRETSKALKAQEKGLLLFYKLIPHNDIKQDIYHNSLGLEAFGAKVAQMMIKA